MKRLFIILALVAFLPTYSFAGNVTGHYEVIAPNVAPQANSADSVVIYEFFAFHCPHCYNLNLKMPQLKKRYGDKVKVISIPVAWAGHDPARLYAIAKTKSEAKGDEVKNMIFDFYHAKGLERSIYSRDKLKFVARFTGLSSEFESMMDDKAIVKTVNDGVELSKQYKVQSTPSLIINGKFSTHGDLDNLFIVLDSYLKK